MKVDPSRDLLDEHGSHTLGTQLLVDTEEIDFHHLLWTGTAEGHDTKLPHDLFHSSHFIFVKWSLTERAFAFLVNYNNARTKNKAGTKWKQNIKRIPRNCQKETLPALCSNHASTMRLFAAMYMYNRLNMFDFTHTIATRRKAKQKNNWIEIKQDGNGMAWENHSTISHRAISLNRDEMHTFYPCLVLYSKLTWNYVVKICYVDTQSTHNFCWKVLTNSLLTSHTHEATKMLPNDYQTHFWLTTQSSHTF